VAIKRSVSTPDVSGDYVLDYRASALSSGAAAFRSAAVRIVWSRCPGATNYSMADVGFE